LYVAALLMFVSELNKRFQVTHLAQLIRTISLGGLGLYLGVFLTVLSIQGAASAVQDGVALKTTKFIASNFIPVIGQTVTDAADSSKGNGPNLSHDESIYDVCTGLFNRHDVYVFSNYCHYRCSK